MRARMPHQFYVKSVEKELDFDTAHDFAKNRYPAVVRWYEDVGWWNVYFLSGTPSTPGDLPFEMSFDEKEQLRRDYFASFLIPS